MFISPTAKPSTPASFFDRRAVRDRRAAVRGMEARLIALEGALPMLALSGEGNVIDATAPFAQLLGTTPELLRGRPFGALLFDAATEGEALRGFLSAIARGTPVVATFRHPGVKGGAVLIEHAATPITGEEAQGASCLVVASDLRARVSDAEAARALDAVASAVMIVDNDLVVTQVNRATRELLTRYAEAFRKVWNGFDPARILGMNIDSFDCIPSHQRRMLADESKLPHRADISVGDLKFALHFTAVHDAEGRRTGSILEWQEVAEVRTQQGMIAAINRSQAVIQFTLEGQILDANKNFLDVLGYAIEEVRGHHHSMFITPAERGTDAYRAFWAKLARGEYDAGVYRRIGKGGREVWIQASYNPILDADGKPYRVVKYATDITEQRLATANFEGQIAAIDRAQAVIEFDLQGRILRANENFLKTLGYAATEVQGRHHSMFVDATYRESAEYRAFWAKLGRGEFDAARYPRLSRDGRTVWIQASYNPIYDLDGKPFKVVKYATDVTAEVLAAQALESAVAETEEIVGAAQRNEFGRRIELSGKDGAIGRLCAGVNSMLATIEAQLAVADALKQAVAETGEIVAAARANDLSRRIDTSGKQGEIGELCSGINGMLDTMAQVVGSIAEACTTISTASREIAMGNSDLSQRTEEQASSLEETSASLEELSGTVRQNADNAQQANKLAVSASDIATRGGAVVSEVVRTMDAITQSSRKINDIIGVIDEIAFQTNILALNAAVEAARAGDQGRGFAVVAAEVRSLAQRSANAAKEIKALISDSVEKVDGGSKLVNTAGQTMDEIVASVKRVTDIMSEISAASQEQSSGIEQVATTVTQMDKMTQQNAALVEEAAAAAKSMEEQTTALSAMVEAFVLPGSEAPAAPVARRPRPAAPAQAAPAAAAAEKRPRRLPPGTTEDDWKAF